MSSIYDGLPVRVAEVVRPAAGGIRRHVSLLLRRADPLRCEPALFAPEGFVPDYPVPHVRQIALDISAQTHPYRDWKAARMLARHLRANLDQNGFELVHAHGLRAALVGVLAARFAALPALFTAHNLTPRLSRLQRLSLAWVGRNSARVVAVSAAVAETLAGAGIDRSRIVVIPNGIEMETFGPPAEAAMVSERARYGVGPGVPLVVAVGRLSPEKGFDLLLSAVPELRRQVPSARILLAGSGPEEAALRRQSAEHGEAVQMLGRVDDVIPLLQAADVVAVPSREEGQGIVALEAMAAYRPVVAARVGGLPETIRDGQDGLLVPPEDPSALASALAALLQDPERRTKMGRSGRSRVEAEYQAETMVKRIEDFYQTIVREHRR